MKIEPVNRCVVRAHLAVSALLWSLVWHFKNMHAVCATEDDYCVVFLLTPPTPHPHTHTHTRTLLNVLGGSPQVHVPRDVME